MVKNRPRRVYLKLGTDCNLHCRYCHAEHTEIRFNSEILPVLKRFGLHRLTFGGGEPLLYWDRIEETVGFLGDDVYYRFVTNGTMFTQCIVDFCNSHNFHVFISLDGKNSTRDDSSPIRWDLIRSLKRCDTAVTVYRENMDIRGTLGSLNGLKRRYLTSAPTVFSSFPNFVHSTSKSGALSDRGLAESYVNQVAELSEEAFRIYKDGDLTPFLENLFARFVKVRDSRGIHCCNDYYVSVLADGRICVCPYTFEVIGDIFRFDDIDWDKVREKYSRPGCRSCGLFGVCGNCCCMNVTDDECYIMKALHGNTVRLMEKHGVTYEELDKAIFH